MATETLIIRKAPQTIDATWFNLFNQVLSGDILPRNGGGAPTSLAGSLGSSVVTWLRAYIASGEWSTGDIKSHHSYNGAASPGDGWMLCDGRQITQVNYDAEHGSGAWASYVGTSPLSGKYLPNLVSRYIQGSSSTSQDGSSPITSVGNSGNTSDFSHNHQWFNKNGATTSDSVFNSSGAQTSIGVGTSKPSGGYGITATPGSASLNMESTALYTEKSLGATQDIRPESIAVQYYMRVV